jgi:hypothetical protein
VTGAVQLQQPQYQAAELLIGVIARGFRVTERAATIRKRRVGESKKGHNVLYGLRFARVIVGTWWRERRQRQADDSGSPSPAVTGRDRADGGTATGGPAAGIPSAGTRPAGVADSRSADLAPRSAKRT